MSLDAQKQLHSQLRTMQDKYTYFLLAVAASAIALSVQVTKNDVFSLNLIPLGIAVLFWALSFYNGCKYIEYMQSFLFSNYEYLRIQDGTHPKVGDHPMAIIGATEGIKIAMEKSASKAKSLAIWQFRFLILGGLFYIIWHLLEMAMRSIGQN
jgi:hypothetical protein